MGFPGVITYNPTFIGAPQLHWNNWVFVWSPTRLSPGSNVPVWEAQSVEWVFVFHVGVSKNRGTPKWMIYNGNPYYIGWFGGTTIFGNTHVGVLGGGHFNFMTIVNQLPPEITVW